MPFVIVCGVVYFGFKLFADTHVLLSLHRAEMESSGIVVHEVCLKIIGVLAFFHLAMLVKFIGEKKLEAVLILVCLLGFTIFVYVLSSRPILKPEYFIDQPVKVPAEVLQKWYTSYSHPLASHPKYAKLVEQAYTNILVVPQGRHLP